MNKKMRIFLAAAVVLTVAVAVAGCASGGKLSTVDATAFERGADSPGNQLVDVRGVSEYDEGHIEGARNIDIDSRSFLSEAKASLDKDKPVYVYCRGGRRSMEAAKILVKNGYKVVNLDGGINKWKSEGKPVVNSCDSVAGD